MGKKNTKMDQVSYDYYVDESKKIWESFTERYQGQFAKDGILSPKVYFEEENIRVLFLLLENYNGEKWHIIEDVENNQTFYKCKENGSKCWAPNIIRTLTYVRCGKWIEQVSDKKEDEVGDKKENEVDGFAYLNFKKKDTGNRKTSPKDIDEYVKNDKCLLKRQIKACKPDVIFCCAKQNFKRLESVLACKNLKQVAIKTGVYKFTYLVNNKWHSSVVVEWFHPSRNIKGFSKANCQKKLEDILETITSVHEENRKSLDRVSLILP